MILLNVYLFQLEFYNKTIGLYIIPIYLLRVIIHCFIGNLK